MRRLNISLTKELYDWVRQQAFNLKISIAKYIRNLIEEKKNGRYTK